MTGRAGAVVVRAASALVAGRLQPAVLTIESGVIRSVDAGPFDGEPDVPAGLHLLPGIVDTHVHVNEPGRTAWEGFATATEAAARGGVTCLVDMPLNSVPPTVDVAALGAKRAAARAAGPRVDVAFWGGVVPASLGALEPLWDAGVLGFKAFLADSGVPEFPPLSPAELDAALREIAGFGGLLAVHAEDPDVLAAAPAPAGPRFRDFLASRPDDAEVVAIRRVIAGVRAHGTRTHVLHLSSARALDDIAAARAEGLPLTVETCPHYLVLDVAALPDAAAEFKCCPPIRDRGNQDALWAALVDGVVDAVVSDHSPSTEAEKRRGGGGDLQQAWGGISGLQVGFQVVADATARRGIALEAVSTWMAAGPARIAGLGAKGLLAPGYDADLVWYDPDLPWTVDAGALAHRNPRSAYTGRVLRGRVTRTVLRGTTVVDGEGRLAPPAGELLARPREATALR
ncbi:MAG: allantoinase AllB [Kineosporiaceae bacterium]